MTHGTSKRPTPSPANIGHLRTASLEALVDVHARGDLDRRADREAHMRSQRVSVFTYALWTNERAREQARAISDASQPDSEAWRYAGGYIPRLYQPRLDRHLARRRAMRGVLLQFADDVACGEPRLLTNAGATAFVVGIRQRARIPSNWRRIAEEIVERGTCPDCAGRGTGCSLCRGTEARRKEIERFWKALLPCLRPWPRVEKQPVSELTAATPWPRANRLANFAAHGVPWSELERTHKITPSELETLREIRVAAAQCRCGGTAIDEGYCVACGRLVVA